MIAFIILIVIVLYIIFIMLFCNGGNVYNKDEKSILKTVQKDSDFKEFTSQTSPKRLGSDVDDDFIDFD